MTTSIGILWALATQRAAASNIRSPSGWRSTTSRPLPRWASATPSDSPIWVAVPRLLPGWRYGRSRSHRRFAQPSAVPAVRTQSCSRMASQTSAARRDGDTGRSAARAPASAAQLARRSAWRAASVARRTSRAATRSSLSSATSAATSSISSGRTTDVSAVTAMSVGVRAPWWWIHEEVWSSLKPMSTTVVRGCSRERCERVTWSVSTRAGASLTSRSRTRSASLSASVPVTLSGCLFGAFRRSPVSMMPAPTSSASRGIQANARGSRPA